MSFKPRSLLLLPVWLCLAGSIPVYSQTGAVQVRMHSCNDSYKYYKTIYLLQQGRELEQFEAHVYKDYLLFDAHRYRKTHTFKGLAPGTYQIRFNPLYRTDSITDVTVLPGQTAKTDICFDHFPQSLADQPTPMDRLALRDTLRLVFRGYDGCLNGPQRYSGLAIARADSGFAALFHTIYDTALFSRDSLAMVYRDHKPEQDPTIIGSGYRRPICCYCGGT